MSKVERLESLPNSVDQHKEGMTAGEAALTPNCQKRVRRTRFLPRALLDEFVAHTNIIAEKAHQFR